jgi:tetratricopeptide (TPR) repeat protein
VPIDVGALWDFSNPELSEERFRSALSTATGDDAAILRTQIARTHGIRGDFEHARRMLAEMESLAETAGPEVQARYHLELGRTYCSATHPPQTRTNEAKDLARAAFTRAHEIARAAKLDGLAIDALHMMTFVDTEPADQVAWNRKALAYMESTSQPEAQKWEGSLRNNTGYALKLLGRHEEALAEFTLALAAREREGDAASVRIAHWMIAWTLRAMGRLREALEIQLRLERECEAAGGPDPYVFEELELLYRELNEPDKAALYSDRRAASG